MAAHGKVGHGLAPNGNNGGRHRSGRVARAGAVVARAVPQHPGLGGSSVIVWESFASLDMRVGRVLEVSDFPEARKPAWKLQIDFGREIGVKRSSAQITNYTREELEGRLVLAVVNLAPRQIGPYLSEVLVLGTYRGETVLLVAPDAGAQPGDKLG